MLEFETFRCLAAPRTLGFLIGDCLRSKPKLLNIVEKIGFVSPKTQLTDLIDDYLFSTPVSWR